MVPKILSALVNFVQGNIPMPKYYVKSGTLEIMVSRGDALEASVFGFLQTNKNDILDEYFYVDERGFRDYITADPKTNVISTRSIVYGAGSEIIGDD